MRKFLIGIAAVAMMLVPAVGVVPVWAADGCANVCTCEDDNGNKIACDGIQTNLLFNTDGKNGAKCYCAQDQSRGSAIAEILMLVLNIFSGLVLVLAVVGMVVAGVQYLTAGSNETQVAKAKMRIFQIVLGLVAYALMWAFLNWLVPGGVFKSSSDSDVSMISVSQNID